MSEEKKNFRTFLSSVVSVDGTRYQKTESITYFALIMEVSKY